MIYAFLTRVPLWLKIAAPCIALMLIAGWIKARQDAHDTNQQQIGAAVQREANQAETIKKVQDANNAEETIRRDPVARDAGCRLHSRTPENCDRGHVVP